MDAYTGYLQDFSELAAAGKDFRKKILLILHNTIEGYIGIELSGWCPFENSLFN